MLCSYCNRNQAVDGILCHVCLEELVNNAGQNTDKWHAKQESVTHACGHVVEYTYDDRDRTMTQFFCEAATGICPECEMTQP